MHVEVVTQAGRVRGAQHAGHQSFLGIPYARPPVGPLRFAAPQPVEAYDGVRDALAFGPIALQAARTAMIAPGVQSEDCLNLNVYTPAADARLRPVLFWIHGGGFVIGAGSEPLYRGSALALRGDVVVVTINYRMGLLGSACLTAAVSGEPPVTNAGQLDQIAALHWVRDNIAAFGGDPQQVTIAGESAGSVAVCALLAMPQARGLFVRAIAQSGTANRLGNRDTAVGTAHMLAKQLDLQDARVDRLRELPVEALMAAQNQLAGAVGLYAPIVDGDSIPERPLSAVRDGCAANIPLLIGTNRDEAKLYIDVKREPLADAALELRVRQLLPHKAREQAELVIAGYRSSRQAHGLPHTNNDILDAIDTASRFRIPTTRLAEAQSAHQPNTFAYLFDWESPARRGALGACHGLELPFMFGNLDAPGMDKFAGTGPAAEALSATMMDAWLAFVKTGDPSCAALGPWPRHDADERKTMLLGARCRVQSAPFEAERVLWDTLL